MSLERTFYRHRQLLLALLSFCSEAMPYLLLCCWTPASLPADAPAEGRCVAGARCFIEVARSVRAVPVRTGVTVSTGVIATDGASWPASDTVLSPSPLLASRKWDGG